VLYKCRFSDCMSILHLYASPDIRVIETRRVWSAGHVECTKKMRNMYRILVGNPWETYYKLETIALNCVLKSRVWRCGLNSPGCDRVHWWLL